VRYDFYVKNNTILELVIDKNVEFGCISAALKFYLLKM